jgi:hypothetical protein
MARVTTDPETALLTTTLTTTMLATTVLPTPLQDESFPI